MLRCLVFAILLWCGLAAAVAPPQPGPAIARGTQQIVLSSHAQSWIDPLGSSMAAIEATEQALPWQTRRLEQTDRIEGKVLWIRFDVQRADDQPWYLEVAAAGIERLELFHRNPAGQWQRDFAGDEQPIASWTIPGRFPTFRLAADAGVTRYWLRVENSRFDFSAPLYLYPERTLLAKRDREQFMLGTYFGLMALLALAAVTSGLAWRDRAFLAFAMYIAFVGTSQLARVGLGAEHVWPEWPYWNDLAVYAWPGLPVAAALWFVRVVTEPARLLRALDLGIMGLVAAVLLAVLVSAFLGTRGSMVLVLALTGFSLAAIAGTLAWGWLDGRDPDLRLVAFTFVPVVLMALLPLARAFEVLQVSGISRNAIFFGTALQMPLLYYALQVRTVRRREAQVRAAALSTTDPLTGLPHRPAFLERLDTTLARSRNSRQNFAVLGVRVANIESIVDEFGREVGEKIIVVAASTLRRIITDVDMAARVGEHDFALLLEGPIETPLVISRAQQVVASGLRQAAALPAAAVIKFHVAVCMLPHQSLDARATLQWVEESLDHITPDAKKLIRALNY